MPSVVTEVRTIDASRRSDVIDRLHVVCRQLEALGVTARIVGSLATGRFRSGSDVDILIMECPRNLKYAIEGMVEDGLGQVSFDVLYLDEISAIWRDRLLEEATDARDLR